MPRVVVLTGLALLATQCATAWAAPSLPYCPGFQIVTAVKDAGADYESIKTVEAVSEDRVSFRYSSERMAFDMFSFDPPKLAEVVTFRDVSRADLDSATLYLQHFDEVLPPSIPETTSNSISRETLRLLKSAGSAPFGVFIPFNVDRPGIDRDQHPNVYDNQMAATVSVAPSRPFRLTLNDDEIDWPVVRFVGDFYGDQSEFVVLDDQANPIMLMFRIGIDAIAPLSPEEIEQRQLLGWPTEISPDKETMRVVKIISPCLQEEIAGPSAGAPVGASGAGRAEPAGGGELAASIEAAIAAAGHAELQAVFFTVDSAELRPESDAALAAVADVLMRNPTWRLSVEGHTDSQADEAYNLDLSQRRAAAVKAALIQRFAIGDDRLETRGLGEAVPIADNATLEGRARNRRVELVRLQ